MDLELTKIFVWLFDMLADATLCVQLGHVCKAVVVIAQNKDKCSPSMQSRFAPLFEETERADKEFFDRMMKQDAKVEKGGNAYICAGPGCKVGAMEKKALMMCGGKCAKEVKPHYCSKECQKKAWPTHK